MSRLFVVGTRSSVRDVSFYTGGSSELVTFMCSNISIERMRSNLCGLLFRSKPSCEMNEERCARPGALEVVHFDISREDLDIVQPSECGLGIDMQLLRRRVGQARDLGVRVFLPDKP